MRVFVRYGNIGQAAKALKTKLGRDGSLKALKLRAAFPKSSDRRKAKQREAARRRNKKK
ncbi:MAG: 30S ribosomal protein S21 [Nitrospina sp.]|jgi:ribosomal protein S21|nr:30S ribosomal protein S21 [Nitrospina sp.]